MYGIYNNNKRLAKFVAPTSVISNRPVLMTDALSLKRNTSKRAAHRWEITSNLEPLSFGANELFALFVKKGNFETIDVIVPQNFGVIEARTSSSTALHGTGVAGATSVDVVQNSGIIPAGTMIRFANHTKVYMVASGLNNSGSMEIYPELRVTVTMSRIYHRDDVAMPCLLDTDGVTGMIYTDGILMDLGAIKLIERLI